MGVKNFKTFITSDQKYGESINLKNKKIAIDGSAVLYFFCKESKGSYSKYKSDLNKFFGKFINQNVELTVFLDGLDPISKESTHEERFKDKVNRFRGTMDILANGGKLNEKSEIFIKLMRVQLLCCLKELNIEAIVSLEEADDEIVFWSIKNNAYGVVSSDTDFCFYQNAPYFIPIDSLANLNNNSLQVRGYKPSLIARQLGLVEKSLPLLALLIGNDYSKGITVTSNYGKEIYGKFRIDYVLNSLRNDLKASRDDYIKILQKYFKGDDLNVCIKSFNQYNLLYNTFETIKSLKEKGNNSKFFSSDCWSDFNYLSALVSDEDVSHARSYCHEASVRYTDSFISSTVEIRQHIFGLYNNLKSFTDIVPDINQKQCIVSKLAPITCEIKTSQCFGGNCLPLEKRIFEFANWFKVMEKDKLLEYSQSCVTENDNNNNKFKLDELLIILFSKFIQKQVKLNVKQWMIECFVLNHLLLEKSSYIRADWSNIKYERLDIKYQPMYLNECYSVLYHLSYTAFSLLNIPTHILKSPDKIIDLPNLHALWNDKFNRDNPLDKLSLYNLTEVEKADTIKRFNQIINEIYPIQKQSDDIDSISTGISTLSVNKE